MQTKLVRKDSDLLADIIVKSVLAVAEKEGEKYDVDIDDIKVEKKAGGSIKDSVIVQGIVLDKEKVSNDMPSFVRDAKIMLVDFPLELKNPEIDTKISISSPEQLQGFLSQEERLIKEMVAKVRETGGVARPQ